MQYDTQSSFRIEGGYTSLTPIALCNLLGGLQKGTLTFRSARVFFACIEMKAIRDAAFSAKPVVMSKRHHNDIKKTSQRIASYGLVELHKRVGGVGGEYLQQDVRLLEKAHLLSFSTTEIVLHRSLTQEGETLLENLNTTRLFTRLIPIPRRLLRHLSQERKPSVFKSMIVYLLRGLSLKRNGSINPKGTMKASLLSELAGISLRAAKTARKTLTLSGWLSEDNTRSQWKLNRTGAYFVVNLSWSPKDKQSQRENNKSTHSFSGPVSPDKTPAKIAPPKPISTGEFAPPRRDLNLPNGIKRDHKLGEPSPSGDSRIKKSTPPRLTQVRREDLRSFSQLKLLYEQAASKGILEPSEANFLNWIAAAFRANAAKVGDPVRIFIGIVRRKLWHHITQAEEEQARRVIHRHRYGSNTGVTGPCHARDIVNDLRNRLVEWPTIAVGACSFYSAS